MPGFRVPHWARALKYHPDLKQKGALVLHYFEQSDGITGEISSLYEVSANPDPTRSDSARSQVQVLTLSPLT